MDGRRYGFVRVGDKQRRRLMEFDRSWSEATGFGERLGRGVVENVEGKREKRGGKEAMLTVGGE